MSSSISFGDANAGFQAVIINGNVDATFHQAPGELRNCLRDRWAAGSAGEHLQASA
jgi:hypothetical protein